MSEPTAAEQILAFIGPKGTTETTLSRVGHALDNILERPGTPGTHAAEELRVLAGVLTCVADILEGRDPS